jgi:hypothetical protein
MDGSRGCVFPGRKIASAVGEDVSLVAQVFALIARQRARLRFITSNSIEIGNYMTDPKCAFSPCVLGARVFHLGRILISIDFASRVYFPRS